MSRNWLVSGFVVALTLALAPAANGASLYSNLAGGGADSSGTGQVDLQTQRLAQPFVATASGTPRLAGFYGVSYLNAPATVSTSIYTNSGGQPGFAMYTGAQATIDDTSDGSPTCTVLTDAQPFGEPAGPLTAGQNVLGGLPDSHQQHRVLVERVARRPVAQDEQ